MENWMEAIHLTESLMVLSLLVAFLLIAVSGQRTTWITTEVIMATALGAGFALLPARLLGYQTKGALKPPETELSRLYGVALLCTGLTYYRTRDTRDATVAITLMTSRIVMSSVLLMVQGFAWAAGVTRSKVSSKDSEVHWGDQFALLHMMPTGLWLLGSLLHLSRAHDFGAYPRHNVRLNQHLRLDAWLQLLMGAAWLAFPSQLSTALMGSMRINKVALHTARSLGALCVGEAVVSLQAPGFLHERDKRAIFLSRIVSTLAQLGALAVSVLLGVVAPRACALRVACVALPSLANALLGLCTDGTTIYTVPHVTPAPTGGSPKLGDKSE